MVVNMPRTPVPNSYALQPAVPPRTAPTGRLANRYNGMTMHSNAFMHSPAQTVPVGLQAAAPLPPLGQHMQPQSGIHGGRTHMYAAPGQEPIYAATPMMSNQRVDSGLRSVHQSANQFPSMASLQNALPQQTASHPPTPPPRPEFLVIGLFALRITRRVILQLDPYPGSDMDLRWLENFIQAYHPSYTLAKLKDPRTIEDYVQQYPGLVRRMIKQPRYRRVFMDMNPVEGVGQRDMTNGESKSGGTNNWYTDSDADELLAIIDFVDAAGEWGSVVPVPGQYAPRMEELAKARRMAD